MKTQRLKFYNQIIKFYNWITKRPMLIAVKLVKHTPLQFKGYAVGNPADVKAALEVNREDHKNYPNTLESKPEVIIKATGEKKKVMEANPSLKKFQRSA
jgi:RNase H-fold protein (predicted Holliday junction resolvase)